MIGLIIKHGTFKHKHCIQLHIYDLIADNFVSNLHFVPFQLILFGFFVTARLCNIINSFLWDVIIHPGSKAMGDWTKLPSWMNNYISAFYFYMDAIFTLKHAKFPYPEPVYTGWSSVHWNATGMPLVDPVYSGTPLEKLSLNSPTLECHWRNLVESAPHWEATGETLTLAAYTGIPLEGLWQPTHAPTHIVKHAE